VGGEVKKAVSINEKIIKTYKKLSFILLSLSERSGGVNPAPVPQRRDGAG